MIANALFGVGLHAIGGIAAATCYVPLIGTKRWSYQTYWLLFCTSAWLVIPVTVALVTVPDLGAVLAEVPPGAAARTTALGAVYGFGGMAFALGIRHIGYSLTYAIAIGISAVLGTVVPAAIAGNLVESFQKPGGTTVLAGFAMSIAGVALCGWAGFRKERELRRRNHGGQTPFNIRKGVVIVAFAGVLSAVFGLSLSAGAPIDAVVRRHGATNFQSHLTYVFAMGGAFLTNLVWWGAVHLRERTFSEYRALPGAAAAGGSLALHYFFGILSGVLWYGQFFFYGLGHVRMGGFAFMSWGIHMTMLVFFSFGIGYALKEWRGFSRDTLYRLYVGLATLLASFCVVTYGSWVGNAA
ncbi:MAG TPA: L-rhamnose/proton symporter RhaT [Woeseiaceae bacterium]|nr:L-rhamnose/proton symporter RhaT [Woeseiaceae bacterium]